ncbi:MAG: MprA protease, GlyGly-CTERM protein-sorting domain-containing form [Planctomycetota bacterium]
MRAVQVCAAAAALVLGIASAAGQITVSDIDRQGAPDQYRIQHGGPADIVVVGLLVRRPGNVDALVGSDSPIQGDGPPPAWAAFGFAGGFDSSNEWEDQFFVDSYTPSLEQFFGLEWTDVAPDEGQTLSAYVLGYGNGDPFGTPFFFNPDDAVEFGETFWALQYNTNLDGDAFSPAAQTSPDVEILLVTARASDLAAGPLGNGDYDLIAINGAFGIPAPGSVALLAAGALAFSRRRR